MCVVVQIAPIIFVLALLRTYKVCWCATLCGVVWLLTPVRVCFGHQFLAFTSVIGDIAVTTGIIAVIIYGTMHSHHLTVRRVCVACLACPVACTDLLHLPPFATV